MKNNSTALVEELVAREAIRELALKYCRGVDRQDMAMLRELYTTDATDTHGDTFDGSAQDYIDFLAQSLPHIKYSGHHVCNHLISVDGDVGEGEVYALAIHVIPDGQGGLVEDAICVRYIDRYRRDIDGKWRFSKRTVTYDYRTRRPVSNDAVAGLPEIEREPTYTELAHSLFARQG